MAPLLTLENINFFKQITHYESHIPHHTSTHVRTSSQVNLEGQPTTAHTQFGANLPETSVGSSFTVV